MLNQHHKAFDAGSKIDRTAVQVDPQLDIESERMLVMASLECSAIAVPASRTRGANVKKDIPRHTTATGSTSSSVLSDNDSAVA
ncbi:hypothetical protein [Paraburkholderia caffeinilytica]|uniref:hypothetical protein n=1 Tax=Paraburkholderia caffeinilytica TaxID=1761016 RepID=UPI003DA13B7A